MFLPIALTSLGGGMFACFLSYYILSFESYSDEYGTSISFTEDYLILFLLGLFLCCLGVFLIFRKRKGEDIKPTFNRGVFAISCISAIYALFMVIKSYVKGYELTPFYWGWLFVSALLLVCSLAFLIQKKPD